MGHSKYCTTERKFRFRDHEEAIEALHRAENARQWAHLIGTSSRRHEKRTYRCPACNGWHLTSQEKRRPPANAVARAQGRGAQPPDDLIAPERQRSPIPAQLTRHINAALGSPKAATAASPAAVRQSGVN